MTFLLTLALLLQAPSFDVAVIKPGGTPGFGEEGNGRASLKRSPVSLTMTNHNLFDLILWAYNVQEYQVSGPPTTMADKYNLLAKTSEAASIDQQRLMLQTLLAERFKLTLHREKREMAVFVLVVAPKGPKLTVSKHEESSIAKLPRPGLQMGFQKASMADLAARLSMFNFVNRPVLDATGLNQLYDFTLDLTGPGTAYQHPDEASPSVNSVLLEQLGLRLESRRAPVEVLVIDHAERSPLSN